MKRYCLALDLKDDPALIAEYEAIHRNVWPEVLASFKEAGIESMELFRINNRLVMVIDVLPHFSFEKKAAADEASEIIRKWEAQMWKYQQALPGTPPGVKWMLMKNIFTYHI